MNQTIVKKTNYFHSAAFMSIVGSEPKLIIDFELYKGTVDSSKKYEGELTVAKRLLSRVAKQHKNTIDVVVYDALELGSGWINHCNKHNITPVIHMKDNNINSIKEVKTQVKQSTEKEIWYNGKRQCEVRAYEEKFYTDGVPEPLRFVKFTKKKTQVEQSQVLLVTTDFDIKLKTLYKIMHQRLG